MHVLLDCSRTAPLKVKAGFEKNERGTGGTLTSGEVKETAACPSGS